MLSFSRFLATVAEGGKGFCLMGSNEVERGQVDSWLEACWNEVCYIYDHKFQLKTLVHYIPVCMISF